MDTSNYSFKLILFTWHEFFVEKQGFIKKDAWAFQFTVKIIDGASDPQL